ncbi:hypothetical protein IQ241_12585 [Romeria aff. gracilis LEGE 07310]|uniref:VapC45 PIN like domain-containing protein n=1 Tax=Vasconcelosia minhoensis LEGE 07310 TaxID=915328 RepID=A0A8J7AIC7_9CYAN|nr:hypothetical protein [Romeria gracilis]MBE9078118.1 hypothetical protein [Romeria aff. gracilis LEGE 07310]
MNQENQPTFFIDRALGRKAIAGGLRKAGATVEIHDDHFPPEALDVEWLPIVGQRGWLILTKDGGIGRRLLEQISVATSEARVFVLSSGNLTGSEMAEIFVSALSRMQRFALGNPQPFIAKVYKSGTVRMWQSRNQLLKLLKPR